GSQVKHLGTPSVNVMFRGTKIAPHPLLADDVVQAVGEPLVAIVAEDAATARDAAELVEVEYEPLPAVVDVEAAQREDAPVIHGGLGTTRALSGTWRSGDVAAAFASAARVVTVRVDQPRLAAVPMEPRTVLARYQSATDELTVWLATQAPFRARAEIASIT